MALASGTKLGPYQILSPLGAGGMGEVYRAKDTRLDRVVAIKVLPASLSSDASLKLRLEREAKAVSKLSHPHICALYDIGHQDGVDFLVMEYLEGETLEQQLTKGPLPPEQTLRYAAQIADALAKAHKLGITHRDLKPANVMLTKSGAKLLDFGLATQSGPEALGTALTAMTMEHAKLTAAGTIVGTFQYMAPEQLEGKEADARTDIFAFGEVLYEMATGKPAFSGTSRASLIAAILTTEPPPITQLQPLSPPALERVVKKCLAKDPDERWQSASDLASELRWIAGGSQSGTASGVTAAVAVSKTKSRAYVPWLVAALALALAAAASARLYLRPSASSGIRSRWIIEPPEKTTLHAAGQEGGPVVVSPDGQRLAFVAIDANGKQQLWVRPLDALQATLVPGTEGGYFPFWSPDGSSLGFFANRQLKRVSLNDGRVAPICDVHLARGGSWNQQGTILFTPNTSGPVYQVAATGGSPVPVTTLDFSQHDSHRWPYFLPDGQHFLFVAAGHDDISHTHDSIYVGSLDGKTSKFLINAHSNAAYADGHLIYLNDTALMARPFDPSRLEFTAEASVAQEGIEEDPGFWLGVFSASQNGVLAFTPVDRSSGNRLTWFSKEGKPSGVVGDVGRYSSLSLSPDGKQAVVEHAQPHHELWIYDLEHNSKSQFTFSQSASAVPLWSPDGKEIVFASDRNGHVDLYKKSASGSASEIVLLQSDTNKYPTDWSPDGKFLLYQQSKQDVSSLWVMGTSGEAAPRLLVEKPFYTSDGAFSPDARWIAYTSQEQGANQVFVMPYSGPGGKLQISSKGGAREPHWRNDGGAVIYSSDDGNMWETAVSVRNGEMFVGATRILFRGNPELSPQAGRTYDIARDGRFLVDTQSQGNQTQIVVVSNWNVGLK